MKVFGERLKKIRVEQKMTQQQFADLLNINKPVITSYELGIANPTAENLLKISQLGYSIDYLLGQTDKKESYYSINYFVDILDILIELDNINLHAQLDKSEDSCNLTFNLLDNPIVVSVIEEYIKLKNKRSSITEEEFEKKLSKLKYIYTIPIN